MEKANVWRWTTATRSTAVTGSSTRMWDWEGILFAKHNGVKNLSQKKKKNDLKDRIISERGGLDNSTEN